RADHAVRRARRPVRVLEPALPSGKETLVDEVEEVEERDVRVARDHRDELRVVRALRRVVERLDVLRPGVVPRLTGRNLRLVSRLVDEEAHERPVPLRRLRTALLEQGLAGAVERVPPRLLEAVEVRAAGVRPREADGRRIRVEVRMAVD